MRKIAFIGAYEKTDMLVYTSKIITELGKKVLIIDTTITQKAKYIIPAMNPTKSYITEYEDMDIAVGFESFSEIKQYLGMSENAEFDYDIIILDIDSIYAFEKFEINNSEQVYFVTGFDLYSLKKGLEILNLIQTPIEITKVMFSKEILEEDEAYLNFLSANYKIKWNENKIYFPTEQGDSSVIIENQRVQKIKIKDLSELYSEGLQMLSMKIIGNVSNSIVKKTVKNIEKGVL